MLSNGQSEQSYSSFSFLLHKLLQRGESSEIVLFALDHFVYAFCLVIVDRVII